MEKSEDDINKNNNNNNNNNNNIPHGEYSIDKHSKFAIIFDYFNFDLNDIDLYKIKRSLNCLANDNKLTENDCLNLSKNLQDLEHFFKETNFSYLAYPYVKNAIMPFYESISKLPNSQNYPQNFYFTILLLSKRKFLYTQIKNYYIHLIKTNNFGISNRFDTVITHEVTLSPEYYQFIESLAEWHSKSELIIFYLTLLYQFFQIELTFQFNPDDYSIDNNFEFSIKSFAKRNILKLAGVIFRNVSLDINLSSVNYQKLFLFIASSLTCGFQLKELFMGDMKQVAVVMGGLIFNLLLSKIASTIDNYSKFVEFRRLADIVKKLNTKLEKMLKTTYELVKMEMLHFCEENGCKKRINILPDIQMKIKELTKKVTKYLEKVDISEEAEIEILEDTLQIQEKLITSPELVNEWIYVYCISQINKVSVNN